MLRTVGPSSAPANQQAQAGDPVGYTARPAPKLMTRILVTVALGMLLMVSGAAAKEIGPEEALCPAIASLGPGEELVLEPGMYRGPCAISSSGQAGNPITIRAKDPRQPPTIAYDGARANVFDIAGSHIVIRDLEFGPTKPDVDAIRLRNVEDIVIENCRFSEVGGISIVAASGRGVVIRGNEISHPRATAVYLGCHNGDCFLTDLLVENNYIHDVSAPPGAVGYGLQVKLNSVAVIRDNVVVNTKGPGIMVYGARDPLAQTIVERNFVARARTSSGIVIGGGPVLVRNNITIGSADYGIALEDYQRRGLLRRIVVAHNTAHGNVRGAIGMPERAVVEARILNNALHSHGGFGPEPPTPPGVVQRGNVNCSIAVPCFRDPQAFDFSPVGMPHSPWPADLDLVGDDYYGRRRGDPAIPGAIQQEAPPIELGIKPRPSS